MPNHKSNHIPKNVIANHTNQNHKSNYDLFIVIYWYMAARSWISKRTIENKHTRKV